MKKIFILPVLALFISFSCLHAQIINKGNILIGGTFSFSSGNGSFGNSSSNANISPRIGYAITNNSVLYVRLGAGFYNSESSGGSGKNNSFNAGVSWKKFYSINEKFGLFTDLFAIIGTGTTRQESTPPTPIYKTSYISYTAGINPGIYFMATPKIIFNADFGGFGYTYQRNKASSQETNHTSTVNINLLSYFGFGVDFIIGGKKS